MACPNEPQLRALLVGDATDADATKAHVATCPACRQTLDRLSGRADTFATLGHVGVSEAATLAPRDDVAPATADVTFGQLQVQALVGEGGMGRVYRAFDPNLHRVVAVKVMAEALAANAVARQRFLREARSAAAVVHENVVVIHQVDESAGVPYLVMQFVAGESLQDRLDREGALPLGDVVRIAAQTAAGLAAAHKQGLVHRDVKPANVLLEEGDGRVKLTDFGLARAVDDASLTQSGVIAGTPQYMSPEQANGTHVDHRSDLFSLGSVIYAMAAGRVPFSAGNTLAVMMRVVSEQPTPLRQFNPQVPEWLARVVERLMAKDPADRFQSADAVADALARPPADTHVSPPAAPRKRQSRVGWWLGGAAAVVVAAALAGAWGLGLFGRRSGAVALPFVVVSENQETRHETLLAAVNAASGGDAIEVRGDGPYDVTPVLIDKPLTLRAADGARPTLVHVSDGYLIKTLAPLAIEGIEFHSFNRRFNRPDGSDAGLLMAENAPLMLTHCRVLVKGYLGVVSGTPAPAEVRHSQLMNENLPIFEFLSGAKGPLVIENCVVGGRSFVIAPLDHTSTLSVEVRRSTCVMRGDAFVSMFWQDPSRAAKPATPATYAIESNVIQTGRWFNVCVRRPEAGNALVDDLLAWQRANVRWRMRDNLFAVGRDFLAGASMVGWGDPNQAERAWKGMFDWQGYWKADAAPGTEAAARFTGGDLTLRVQNNLANVTPADFRLARGTPGKGRGEGGKDLGADVDAVGPGEPYVRWTKTDDCAAWRKKVDAAMGR